MIDYDRGSWYGIHLLFRLRGSLLPRCVPAALLGAVPEKHAEARSEYREVHPRRVEDALRGRLGVVDAEDVERLLRQQRADEAEEEHARRREDGAALRAADRACVE